MQEFFTVKLMITQEMAGRLGEVSGPTMAGVSRYNRNLILDDSQHLITFDLGGTLGIDQESTGVRNPSITSMNYMGYDFVSLNSKDLSNISKLRRALGFSIPPFISCNLVHPTTKEPFFGEPYLMLDINGMKVAVIGAYAGPVSVSRAVSSSESRKKESKAGADQYRRGPGEDYRSIEDRYKSYNLNSRSRQNKEAPEEPIVHISKTAPAIRRTLRYIYDNEETDYVIAVLSDYDENAKHLLDDLEGVGIVITGGKVDPDVVEKDESQKYQADDVESSDDLPLYHHHHTGHVMSIDIEFKRRMTSFEYIGHTVRNMNQEIAAQSDDLNLVDQIYYHL